ncbi:MAG: UDP-2,3-diacylglucosamine diphosphatase [Gammaproteobacteria bacterium]|nr:UDP-2,3-diacylglucosamine diphosphatase [Gammaproteobacteria bacterium]
MQWLQGPALQLDRLYILGDLFEYWIGDDDPDPHHRAVRDALRNYTRTMPRVWFMAGNRDFQIGELFLRETGIQQLPDPSLIEVGGISVLIAHGDRLCTDDVSYQRFRRFAQHPSMLKFYRSLPFFLRRRLVNTARERSHSAKLDKSAEIMDVNQAAVENALRRYRVHTLLHGHTHRPGEHQFELEGREATRIVLGDWYRNGPVMYWDDEGRRVETLTFADA